MRHVMGSGKEGERCSRRPRPSPPGAALRRGAPPGAAGSWSAGLWPPPALCGLQGSSSPKRPGARGEEAVSWGSSRRSSPSSPWSSTSSPFSSSSPPSSSSSSSPSSSSAPDVGGAPSKRDLIQSSPGCLSSRGSLLRPARPSLEELSLGERACSLKVVDQFNLE
ncbi:unnamed protein product [Rangifer tarandus platyrhynchus]|uniref:Uncharacterized protein n=1 Tax=Rangifer tarandus platyrhynchus TaxID=3082113 RepID=A0AC59YPW3_RANTA